jgi:GNAT superfamily N-acetyltransferase
MVLVRAVCPADWPTMRDIRLTALRDAPDAFAATHQEEAAFAEADWQARITGGGTFLAYLPEVCASEPVGMAAGFRPAPKVTELVAMYVRPPARGRGVGQALIEAVIDWAAKQHTSSVHLWVNETNSHARLLYERSGFMLTGDRQPLPANPSLIELAMTRTL